MLRSREYPNKIHHHQERSSKSKNHRFDSRDDYGARPYGYYPIDDDEAYKLSEQERPRKLIDCPPYPSIRMTLHGLGAERPWRTDAGNKKVEHDYNGGYKVRDVDRRDFVEDVDAEAEDFIKLEHRKFELRNWMSMNFNQ